MKAEKLTLVQREYDLLSEHLVASHLSHYNKRQLLQELNSATLVKDDELESDTVCINSEVEIREIGTSSSFIFQIVMPNEANMKKSRVSVFAPIAIALLGYSVGSKVQWEMPEGLKTFEILRVMHKEKIMI